MNDIIEEEDHYQNELILQGLPKIDSNLLLQLEHNENHNELKIQPDDHSRLSRATHMKYSRAQFSRHDQVASSQERQQSRIIKGTTTSRINANRTSTANDGSFEGLIIKRAENETVNYGKQTFQQKKQCIFQNQSQLSQPIQDYINGIQGTKNTGSNEHQITITIFEQQHSTNQYSATGTEVDYKKIHKSDGIFKALNRTQANFMSNKKQSNWEPIPQVSLNVAKQNPSKIISSSFIPHKLLGNHQQSTQREQKFLQQNCPVDINQKPQQVSHPLENNRLTTSELCSVPPSPRKLNMQIRSSQTQGSPMVGNSPDSRPLNIYRGSHQGTNSVLSPIEIDQEHHENLKIRRVAGGGFSQSPPFTSTGQRQDYNIAVESGHGSVIKAFILPQNSIQQTQLMMYSTARHIKLGSTSTNFKHLMDSVSFDKQHQTQKNSPRGEQQMQMNLPSVAQTPNQYTSHTRVKHVYQKQPNSSVLVSSRKRLDTKLSTPINDNMNNIIPGTAIKPLRLSHNNKISSLNIKLFEGGEIPNLQIPLRQIHFSKKKSKYALQGVKIVSGPMQDQDVLSQFLNGSSESIRKNKDYISNSRSRVQKQIYGEKMQKINKDLPPPPMATYFRDYGILNFRQDEIVDQNNINWNSQIKDQRPNNIAALRETLNRELLLQSEFVQQHSQPPQSYQTQISNRRTVFLNNANHQGSQETIKESKEQINQNSSNIVVQTNKHIGQIISLQDNSKSRFRKDELSLYSSDSLAESKKSLNILNPAENSKFDPYLFSPKMQTQATVNNTFINFEKESATPQIKSLGKPRAFRARGNILRINKIQQ